MRRPKIAQSAAAEARESEASFIAFTAAADECNATLAERRSGAGFVLTFTGRLAHFADLPSVGVYLEFTRWRAGVRAKRRRVPRRRSA